MVELVVSPMCCGVWEINNLGQAKLPEDVLKTLGARLNNAKYPFVLFSGVVERKREDHTLTGRADNYGRIFSQYIRKNKLGTVRASEKFLNPRTTNLIRVWVWEPDYKTLAEHIRGLTASS